MSPLTLEPLFFTSSLSSVGIKIDFGKYRDRNTFSPPELTDEINSPVAGWGGELENPISDAYEEFTDDIRDILRLCNCAVAGESHRESRRRVRHCFRFTNGENICGKIVFDLRVSDHLLKELLFSASDRRKVSRYLSMKRILNGGSKKASVEFAFYKSVLGEKELNDWADTLGALSEQLLTI